MGKILSAAVALALCGCATSENLDRPSYYVGVNGTYALEKVKNSGVPGLHIDDAFAYNARVGYRTGAHFAAELQAESLGGGFDAEISGVGVGDITGKNVGLNAKYYEPFGALHPYVMAGFGYIHMNVNGGGIGHKNAMFSKFGGGIDYYLTDGLYLNTEAFYVLPTGSLQDYKYYTVGVGVGYRF